MSESCALLSLKIGLWVKMQAATCLHAFYYKGLGAVETFEY